MKTIAMIGIITVMVACLISMIDDLVNRKRKKTSIELVTLKADIAAIAVILAGAIL